VKRRVKMTPETEKRRLARARIELAKWPELPDQVTAFGVPIERFTHAELLKMFKHEIAERDEAKRTYLEETHVMAALGKGT